MGTFLLCSIPKAEHPYEVPALGLRLYTAEELCYYMEKYLVLLDDNFVSEDLMRFLGKEMGLKAMTEKIRRWADTGADMLTIVLMIQQDIHYFSEGELANLQTRIDALRAACPQERAKLRADFYLNDNRVMQAIHIYDAIVRGAYGERTERELLALVRHNLGVAYARLFEPARAMEEFDRSYRLDPAESTAKEMVMLSAMYDGVTVPVDVLDAIPASSQYTWNEEFETMFRKAIRSGKALEAQVIMEKDSVRRNEGLNRLLGDWKQEYRRMVRE